MIDFELSEGDKNIQQMVKMLSENMLRPLSKKYDSYEHEHDEKVELEQVAALCDVQAVYPLAVPGLAEQRHLVEMTPRRDRGQQ